MNKKTFWPYGILLSIFAIVCACAYTIYYSLDYPVYIDDFYFDKYQNVENNYNEIQLAQSKFNSDISFNANPKILINGEENSNHSQILRRQKSVPVVNLNSDISLIFDANSTNFSADILLTRPHTSEFDRNLSYKIENSKLKIENFSLKNAGRWLVKLKLTANADSIGFYALELYAK